MRAPVVLGSQSERYIGKASGNKPQLVRHPAHVPDLTNHPSRIVSTLPCCGRPEAKRLAASSGRDVSVFRCTGLPVPIVPRTFPELWAAPLVVSTHGRVSADAHLTPARLRLRGHRCQLLGLFRWCRFSSSRSCSYMNRLLRCADAESSHTLFRSRLRRLAGLQKRPIYIQPRTADSIPPVQQRLLVSISG